MKPDDSAEIIDGLDEMEPSVNGRVAESTGQKADALSRARYGRSRTTLSETPGGAGNELSVHEFYAMQISSMHGIPVDASQHGRVGNLWLIDPVWGEGSYWYCSIDDMLTVNVIDMSFSRPIEFRCDTPDLFCFGSYGRNMVPYFGDIEDPADRTLMGYAWKGQPYVQRVDANKHLDVTSICLLPSGLRRLSLECRCDPVVASRAIASLDGAQEVPGLNIVLDEMRRARPSSTTAHAYYLAKATEATALLVDWSLSNPGAGRRPIRAADQAALSAARMHLRDNLDRSVSSDELCRVACMSASKLARLFRQAEDMTPQEYARMLRMERACELLEQSDLSMAKISSLLGFAQQGTFSEAFKERFGVTPRDYRLSQRRNGR